MESITHNLAITTILYDMRSHVSVYSTTSRLQQSWGRIIKSIYKLVSHCLAFNSSHNVVNHAIGIREAFSNVNIDAKLLSKLQEIESSCRCTYNGVGGAIM